MTIELIIDKIDDYYYEELLGNCPVSTRLETCVFKLQRKLVKLSDISEINDPINRALDDINKILTWLEKNPPTAEEIGVAQMPAIYALYEEKKQLCIKTIRFLKEVSQKKDFSVSATSIPSKEKVNGSTEHSLTVRPVSTVAMLRSHSAVFKGNPTSDNTPKIENQSNRNDRLIRFKMQSTK